MSIEGIPEHWSKAARDAVEEIVNEREKNGSPLSAAEFAALEQFGELVSAADALSEIARASNYEAIGSQGQKIVHPAVGEARQARKIAAEIAHKLTQPATGAKLTNSERGRQAAMARWNPHHKEAR